MPLKLVPPRAGRTPFWSVRGTHLGVRLDRSTGLAEKARAAVLLRRWREDIERGVLAATGERLFLDDIVAYVEAGGEALYLGAFDEATGRWSGLAAELGPIPSKAIDQQMIDDAALKLLPRASAATRNRQIYTPVSAVLKQAGRDWKIRRPKGWQGRRRVDWRTEEQAFRILETAERLAAEEAALAADPAIDGRRRVSHRKTAAKLFELAIFLELLLYTGMRLSEALKVTCERVEPGAETLWLPATKNGRGRAVHLPPPALAALKRLPRGLARRGERLFSLRKHGRLYALLRRVLNAAGADVSAPGQAFHILRHTWATWMRRHGGLDTTGLVSTGAWIDRNSAAVYEHTTVTEEARRADLLPARRPRRA